MGFVELILTVCTLTQPASCEERHLSFVDEGSLVQCMSQAPPAMVYVMAFLASISFALAHARDMR